jgi:hypothetical protein
LFSSLAGRLNHRLAHSDDDVNVKPDQFRRDSGEPLHLPLGKSVFDLDVATFDVAEVTQVLEQDLSPVSGRVGPQPAYSRDLPRLLGLGGERRGEERTSASKERAAVHHSIT